MKTARQHSSRRERAHPQVRPHARQRQRNRSWLPLSLIALGGLVLAVLVGLSFREAGAQSVQPVRAGAKVGDFALTDLAGKNVRLSDYQGQVVLINAWATWCPPCRAEMPALNAYYQARQADGFTILAVNAGESRPEAAAFAERYGLAFPVLLDSQMRVLNGLNIHSFPTSILVGRDGVVKDIHIGMLTPQQIEAKINPLLEP